LFLKRPAGAKPIRRTTRADRGTTVPRHLDRYVRRGAGRSCSRLSSL